MPLASGQKLGPYEVVSQIGAGGMGEVYRARDSKLKRDVAIKVLPADVANDRERLARFQREAEVLASLNHPNIAQVHGLEDGALIMELVDGEDLSQRIRRGPIPIDEALAIAKQLAEALEAAHESGIIHRDLKPANVKVKEDGTVKVLDFGLAKGSGIDDRGAETLANSPTITSPAMTMRGVILGTAAYMAPEQARGRVVDRRADIWAFGCVLYEMLTGRRVFQGEDVTDVITSVMRDTPDWSLLPADTPAGIRMLLRRCLEKDPRKRAPHVSIARLAIDDASTTTVEPAAEPVRRSLVPLATIAALSAGIIGGAIAWMVRPPSPPSPTVSRFIFAMPEGQRFTGTGRHLMTLSPDGTRLVYVANEQLYLRNMNELASAGIPGTEGSAATEPVFSPDGQWVAFYSRGALKKVPVMGGTPVLLATIGSSSPLGATWEGGRILLAQPTPPAIVEIPENGGAANQLVTLNEKSGEQAGSPQFVAGGRALLFTLRARDVEWEDASIIVQHLATGQRSVLLHGTDARVLPTGHLVFTRGTTIFAVPFDEKRLTITGGPVPVQQGIQTTSTSGISHVAWSSSGTFAFAQGGLSAYVSSLFWVSRDGKEERTKLPARNHGLLSSEMRASPSATRVAVTVYSDDVLNLGPGASSEVWVGDIARGTLTRLSKSGQATSPVWTSDGERVCYDSASEVFCQAADGSGVARALFKVDGLRNTRPFSRDQTRMLLETRGLKTGDDISIATIGPPVETRPLLNTTASESAPTISPDGRWLAYQSDESGRAEVYVRPFPEVDQERWTISAGGGTEPRWAPNGRELFFTVRSGGWTKPGVLMSVPVRPGSAFIAGQPITVLKIPAGASEGYDVAPDGRFLFHFQRSTHADEGAPRQEIIVVQNWFEELKARVPTAVAK